MLENEKWWRKPWKTMTNMISFLDDIGVIFVSSKCLHTPVLSSALLLESCLNIFSAETHVPDERTFTRGGSNTLAPSRQLAGELRIINSTYVEQLPKIHSRFFIAPYGKQIAPFFYCTEENSELICNCFPGEYYKQFSSHFRKASP